MRDHNVEWAAKKLNEHEHVGRNDWKNSPSGVVSPCRISDDYLRESLSLDSNEAIAVAEWLERQAGQDMPATRKLIDALTAMVAYYDQTTPEHMDCISLGGKRIQPETLREIVAEWEGK